MANAHLLVVDDEPNILTSLSTALRLEGYAVDVAGGIRVAEDKITKRAYDLLLLDVALPDGDGIDLLTRLRAARNEIPCIVMSGHGTIDAAVRATRLGALDFLEKPLSTDRLLLVLDNTLRLVRAEAEARELKAQAGFDGEILGDSAAMQLLRERIARASKAKDASVLVVGERGTGKELVARAIHMQSPRARGPLEKLNCAAVPGELIESELFGHEAGAFTGATKSRRGKFERAGGGTLFLDEVGDMPMPMQAKLLRVLQEREIERVGGGEVIKVDVRIVAATNRDLLQAIAAGSFRADLYDRLHVVPIEIPPLRARREDVPLLARRFLELASRANDRRGVSMTADALQVLAAYSFRETCESSKTSSSDSSFSVRTRQSTRSRSDRFSLRPGPCTGRTLPTGCSFPRAHRRGGAHDFARGAEALRRPNGRHGARTGSGAQPPLQEVSRPRTAGQERGRRRERRRAGSSSARVP